MDRLLRGRWLEPFFLGVERQPHRAHRVRVRPRRRRAQPADVAVLPAARLRGALVPAEVDARGRRARPRRLPRSSPRPTVERPARRARRCCSPRASSPPRGSAPGSACNHDRHRRELDRASRTDPLTGCLNRRGFRERAGRRARPRRAATAARSRSSSLDLDDFKSRQRPPAATPPATSCCAGSPRRSHDDAAHRGHGRAPGRRRVRARPRRQRPAIAVERVRARLAERAPAVAGVAPFPVDGIDADALHHDRRRRAVRRTSTAAAAPRRTSRRELSWAAALAAAVDERMAVQHEHSHAVAALRRRDRPRAWAGARPTSASCASPRCSTTSARSACPRRSCASPGRSTPTSGRRSPSTRSSAPRSSRASRACDAIGPWIRHSHERIDGAGYPDGLRRRRDPARLAHPARRRRVRRDDQRPLLPPRR